MRYIPRVSCTRRVFLNRKISCASSTDFRVLRETTLGTIILSFFFISLFFFLFHPLGTDVIEIIGGMRHSPRRADKNRSFRANSLSRCRDKREKHPRGTGERSD